MHNRASHNICNINCLQKYLYTFHHSLGILCTTTNSTRNVMSGFYYTHVRRKCVHSIDMPRRMGAELEGFESQRRCTIINRRHSVVIICYHYYITFSLFAMLFVCPLNVARLHSARGSVVLIFSVRRDDMSKKTEHITTTKKRYVRNSQNVSPRTNVIIIILVIRVIALIYITPRA